MRGEDADTLLARFLEAGAEADEQRLLARLVEQHAAPAIRAILGRLLRGAGAGIGAARGEDSEAEDLYHEVVAAVLEWLRACKSAPEAGAVGDFRAYVAVIAYRAFDHYLRRRRPERWAVKRRIIYLLSRQPGLALWTT